MTYRPFFYSPAFGPAALGRDFQKLFDEVFPDSRAANSAQKGNETQVRITILPALSHGGSLNSLSRVMGLSPSSTSCSRITTDVSLSATSGREVWESIGGLANIIVSRQIATLRAVLER